MRALHRRGAGAGRAEGARRRHRRHRHPRQAGGRRRLPGAQRRPLPAHRRRHAEQRADGAGLVGRPGKLRRRWPRHHPLPAYRTDHAAGPGNGARRAGESAMRLLAALLLARRRAGARGLQPAAGAMGRPPAARSAPGGAGEGADGAIALPGLPGPVDRRQRCRAGRRHAAHGAQPDRRRPVARARCGAGWSSATAIG